MNLNISSRKLVDVGPRFVYMELENVDDPSDRYCYEVNTLSETNMALDYLGDLNMNLTHFKRWHKKLLQLKFNLHINLRGKHVVQCLPSFNKMRFSAMDKDFCWSGS